MFYFCHLCQFLVSSPSGGYTGPITCQIGLRYHMSLQTFRTTQYMMKMTMTSPLCFSTIMKRRSWVGLWLERGISFPQSIGIWWCIVGPLGRRRRPFVMDLLTRLHQWLMRRRSWGRTWAWGCSRCTSGLLQLLNAPSYLSSRSDPHFGHGECHHLLCYLSFLSLLWPFPFSLALVFFCHPLMPTPTHWSIYIQERMAHF